MADSKQSNEMNKHISSVESSCDVLHVMSKHGLLGEVKSSSISYLCEIKRWKKDIDMELQWLKSETR
jgi:uncharacterized protein Yka (UPF0111/DUF47 family)